MDGWDLEADVVVVGLGAAGACAVLGAIEAGADVLALEAAGAGGGTSAMSGGLIYLGGGTPVQEASGFADSADDMFRFLMAASGPDPDEAKIRAYCDGSVTHYQWLVEVGVPFKATFFAEPGLEPPTDDGLVYSGGEDAFPFDRLARPAPRAHKPQHRHAAGRFLMDRLLGRGGGLACPGGDRRPGDPAGDAARRKGDRAWSARQAGRDLLVHARRGVVLCAGGFVHNDEMVRRHTPLVARCSMRLGNDFDDGRAIRMAQAAGAAVTRMDAAEVAVPITPPRKLVTGILVNGQGQRFINEDTYYGRVGQEILFRQDGEAYLIVDEALYEVTRAGLAASWVAETPERAGGRDGPALRLAAGHPGPLQPSRRRRSRPAVPQGRARSSARWSGRSAPTTCGSPTRPASTPRSRSAGWSPRSTARSATSTAGPSPGCSPPGGPRRAWPPSATPAGSRWATPRSSAAGPDSRGRGR